MSFSEDLVGNISERRGERIVESDMRPRIEVWPEEDDFGRWVASHESAARSIVCATPEYRDAPFCGRGVH